MDKIIKYLKDYFKSIHKITFLFITTIAAASIFINYHYHVNEYIYSLGNAAQFAAWSALFFTAFGSAYFITAIIQQQHFIDIKFISLILFASFLFSWKMTAQFHFNFSPNKMENHYWNQIVYWPLKFIVLSIFIFLCSYFIGNSKEPFAFYNHKNPLRPYAYMLLIMVPVIAIAATMPSFLAVYPKLKQAGPIVHGYHKTFYALLYELAYGIDFFTIELFFRGFLVLTFLKWAGKDAILPMALFYCTIHFGKPAGECISSFFGGIVLGVVVYHTRSILGGLIVHLGIAWLMEIGGYIGAAIK